MPKRTRATKETDKNKSWNRKNTVKLTEPSIIPEETILIVCEGQSEELYFKNPVTLIFELIEDLED